VEIPLLINPGSMYLILWGAGRFLGLMPKKNRTMFLCLTNSSYSAMTRAKETTLIIRYFGKMPRFQRMTNQPTVRIIV